MQSEAMAVLTSAELAKLPRVRPETIQKSRMQGTGPRYIALGAGRRRPAIRYP